MHLNFRFSRISNEIYKILAKLLHDTTRNYWLLHVVITDVEVSKDLKHASIFFYSSDKHLDKANILKALNHSLGFFRTHLAKKMSLHTVPKLNFFYDNSIEYGKKIDALVQKTLDI